MVKFKPFLSVCRFPNFKLKIKLGALLLCLSFLFNYQPSLTFPPVKNNLVYAQIQQETSVAPKDLGMTFQLPFDGYITTPFSSYHPGIDLCAGLGLPVKPIAKGTVVNTGYNFFGLGLVVEVDHGNGYRSLYAHLGKIYTEVGKEINENSYLGEIGLTGNTSGPHTHLEVFKDGTRIDPRLILPTIRSYPRGEDFAKIRSATPSAIAIPVLTSASKSAQVRPLAIPQPDNVAQMNTLEKILPQGKQAEVKPDLKQQSLNNILSFTLPKPSAQPLPQGGEISLKNFTLLGFNR